MHHELIQGVMVMLWKWKITPHSWNFHSWGACHNLPPPGTAIILFMSRQQLLYKLLCKPWKMHSAKLKQKIADENNFSFEILINSKLTDSLLINLTLSPRKRDLRGHPPPPRKLSLFRPPFPQNFRCPSWGGGGGGMDALTMPTAYKKSSMLGQSRILRTEIPLLQVHVKSRSDVMRQ